MTRRTGSRALLTAIGLAAVLSASPARADRPTFTDDSFTFVDGFLSDFCGFPVQVHVSGKFIDKQDGDTFKTLFTDYTVAFTNLETGRTFSYKVSGQQSFDFSSGDGVFVDTFSFRGAFMRLVIPGQGAVLLDAGLVSDRFTFDTTTDPPTFTYEHTDRGQHDDSLLLTDEAICALLSD
jgi:hypothetical protein